MCYPHQYQYIARTFVGVVSEQVTAMPLAESVLLRHCVMPKPGFRTCSSLGLCISQITYSKESSGHDSSLYPVSKKSQHSFHCTPSLCLSTEICQRWILSNARMYFLGRSVLEIFAAWERLFLVVGGVVIGQSCGSGLLHLPRPVFFFSGGLLLQGFWRMSHLAWNGSSKR